MADDKNPGSENSPEADSQPNGPQGNGAQSGDSPIPEVEAEIVEDDPAQAEAAEPTEPKQSESAPAQKSSTLTPGVILFAVFTIVALILFFLWRSQSAPDSQPDTDLSSADQPSIETSLSPPEESGLAETGTLGADDGKETAQAAPTSEVEEVIATPALPAADLETKITNDPVADIKEGLSDRLDEGSTSGAEDVFLPPLSDPSAPKIDLTPAHEEKITTERPVSAPPSREGEGSVRPGDLRQETPAGTTGDTITDFEPEAVEPSGEIELAEPQEAETSTQPENQAKATDIDADDAAIETPPASSSPTGMQAEKLTNDIALLKTTLSRQTNELSDALEAERDRSALLREDIQRMRQEFEAALAARDERSSQQIASLRADLEKIQNTGGVSPARVAAGAIAFSALQRALNSGAPYKAELDVLARLSPDAAPIDKLRNYAETGAPSLGVLQDGFPVAAREALKTAGQLGAKNFWGRLGARAASLVSVRPAAPLSGDSARAVISRAENAVAKGDVELALNELSALPEPVLLSMDEWIVKARARTNLIAASNDLSSLFEKTGEEQSTP